MSTTPTDDMLYGLDKGDNYYDAASSPSTDLGASASGAGTPLDETPEERERRMTELKEELEKVESEINMLRQVLGSKVRHASELKRRMGITPFQEFKQDLQSGIQQIKSSDPYQKTSAVVKTATEKTSSAISTVGQVVAKKMGDIKNSQTFKSFDEKMHNTYANVKSSRSIEGLKERLARVTGSRSSSEIDDAFRDAHSADENLITTPESADDAANINLPEDKLPL
ncbi:tumor protein D52-like isoform X3 [Physella acuta]|uniref:tumor protein D52-like isoform X3 n=1 Tax=Physella acuta TaxID=109671 RepID=UPI0027DD180E|nr:tumor protein D52-like isoform X3 [Physella acuta]